jgi:uncharacterized protein (TIGR02145 family)
MKTKLLIAIAIIGLSCQKISIDPLYLEKDSSVIAAKVLDSVTPLPEVWYGCLYNFYAASDPKLAPEGWHVPTHSDFVTLITNAGGKLKEVGFEHWQEPNAGANNESWFTALPGGLITDQGECFNRSLAGYFWSSNSRSNYYAYLLKISCYNADPLIIYTNINYGLSVRLVKDSSEWEPGETVTDYDENVYDTILIDGQVWMVQNFKCTHLNDGTPIPQGTEWNNLTSNAYCNYEN